MSVPTSELQVRAAPAMELVRDLARRLYEMGGDLQSLGHGETSAPADAELLAGLQQLAERFDYVQQLVFERRNRLIAGQLRQLVVERQPLAELRLHFGAGGIHLPGWINVDAPPAELSLNLARGILLPDGSARYIYASHLLEHLYYPVEASRFIAECRRLLDARGVLRLIVPDIGESLRAYAAGDRGFFARRQQQFPGWPAGRTMLEDILAYAGAFPDPAAFFEAHKYGYDFETLRRLLQAHGFSRVSASSYMGSGEPELRIDDRSAVASAANEQQHYSLFVEAMR